VDENSSRLIYTIASAFVWLNCAIGLLTKVCAEYSELTYKAKTISRLLMVWALVAYPLAPDGSESVL